MDHLAGKTMLITGASRGIGEATARLFVEAGANVALVARSEDAIANLAGELRARSIAIPCDVSRYWEMSKAVDATVETFGGLDILINNAGIQHVSPIEDFPTEKWDAILAINLTSAFHTTAVALPMMRKAGWGRGGFTIVCARSGRLKKPWK